MTPQETLHSILLDAKARIKNGELYNDKGDKCSGICEFVYWHNTCIFGTTSYLDKLIEQNKDVNGNYVYIATSYDFTDPKRLALLDWLIERTAP